MQPVAYERPVFVAGASRSGTALLRSALNRSGSVFVAGETHYFDDLRPRLAAPTTTVDEATRAVVEDYFLALSHRPYGHGGTPDRARIARSALRAEASALGGTADDYFKAYCRLAVQLETDPDIVATERWGEKTPRHVFRLADMLTRYAGAKVVVMYRDPRAVAASYAGWTQQGGLRTLGDDGYAESLTLEEERARASYDPSVLGLLWRATVRAGMRARKQFGDDRVLLLRYEDLVADPRKTLIQVSEFLDLPFGERMLDVPMHNSSFTRFDSGSGVSTEPVERWRRTLPPKDVAIVEHWCRAGLAELGYERTTGTLALLPRLRVWAAVPVAGIRAVWVNRRRAGKMLGYVWRRVRLMREG